MEWEIYLYSNTEIDSLSMSGSIFHGLTSAGTIRLLSLKGIPRPRNVFHMYTGSYSTGYTCMSCTFAY